MTAAFDTLTTARALEAAGIERRQAEAIAEGMRRAVRKADRARPGQLVKLANREVGEFLECLSQEHPVTVR